MLLGLDIDNVVADFLSPFLVVVERKIGKQPISVDTIVDLTFRQHPEIPENIAHDCMREVSYDPTFWEELAPLPSAEQWNALDALSRENRLVFITHRYERETYDIGRITRDWLSKHGVSRPVVYFTQSHKSELIEKLKVELFVDDRHENCQDAAENTRAVVMMPHRTYNSAFNHPRVQRIQDLAEVFSFLTASTLPREISQ